MSTGLAILFSLMALIAAGVVVSRASAAHAVVSLLGLLVAMGAAFFALSASFAGALQLLIYAGAVIAVFIFALITLDQSPAAISRERQRFLESWRTPAAVAAIAALAMVAALGAAPEAPVRAVTPKDVGELLFGPWALAVEAASLLLLAALIGVRHIGDRARKAEDEQ